MFHLLFRSPHLPLKLAFTISLALSFSVSCCATPSSPSSHASARPRSPTPSPKAVVEDLLSVHAARGGLEAPRLPPVSLLGQPRGPKGFFLERRRLPQVPSGRSRCRGRRRSWSLRR
ncbi:unnamed protein product [Urochloa humidicola]